MLAPLKSSALTRGESFPGGGGASIDAGFSAAGVGASGVGGGGGGSAGVAGECDIDVLLGQRGFYFSERTLKLDLEEVGRVDLNQIYRDVDVEQLQAHLETLTFANLESSESRAILRGVDPNFLKLFQLAQLTVEYLLSVQDALVEGLETSSKQCRSMQRKLEKCKARIKEQDSQINAYKHEVNTKRSALHTYEALVSHTVANTSLGGGSFAGGAPLTTSGQGPMTAHYFLDEEDEPASALDDRPSRQPTSDARRADAPAGPPPTSELVVFVCTRPDGQCSKLLATPATTVAELKEQLRHKLQESDRPLVLMHHGFALDDNALTLQRCGVANGATLLLVDAARQSDAGDSTRAELEALDGRVKGLGDMIRGELLNQFEDELGDIRTKLSQNAAPPAVPARYENLAGPLESDDEDFPPARPVTLEPQPPVQRPAEPPPDSAAADNSALAGELSEIKAALKSLIEQNSNTAAMQRPRLADAPYEATTARARSVDPVVPPSLVPVARPREPAPIVKTPAPAVPPGAPAPSIAKPSPVPAPTPAPAPAPPPAASPVVAQPTPGGVEVLDAPKSVPAGPWTLKLSEFMELPTVNNLAQLRRCEISIEPDAADLGVLDIRAELARELDVELDRVQLWRSPPGGEAEDPPIEINDLQALRAASDEKSLRLRVVEGDPITLGQVDSLVELHQLLHPAAPTPTATSRQLDSAVDARLEQWAGTPAGGAATRLDRSQRDNLSRQLHELEAFMDSPAAQNQDSFADEVKARLSKLPDTVKRRMMDKLRLADSAAPPALGDDDDEECIFATGAR